MKTSIRIFSSFCCLVTLVTICFSCPFARSIINHQLIEAKAISSAKLDVILLVDTSGSMSGSSNQNCKSAAKQICEDIFSYSTNARIGIVSFASSVTSFDFSNEKSTVLTSISSLGASGGTYIIPGINAVINMMSSINSLSAKSVVIISDGAISESQSNAVSAIDSLKQTCNVISIGVNAYGSNASVLKALANQGYYDFNGGSLDSKVFSSLKYGYTAPAMSSDEQQIIDALSFDVESLLSNIKLGNNDTLNFPSVPVKGKETAIGNFSAEVGLPFKDSKLSFTVDRKKKLIKVLIGFDDDQSATIGPDGNENKYWSESYSQVKTMYQNITGKKVSTTKLWNQFSSLRGDLKEMKCSLGVSFSAKIAGYLELSYENNQVDFSEGGILASIEGKAELTEPIAPVPACFVSLSLKPKIEGTIGVEKESSQISYFANLNGSITTSISLGIGDKKITKTYLELGVEGSIQINCKLPANSLKKSLNAKLTSKAFAKSKILGFDILSKSYDLGTVQIYPHDDALSLQSIMETEISDTDNYYENAVLMSRDYSFDVQSAGSDFILDDTYQQVDSQISFLPDGKVILVWVGDDGTSSLENRTAIYFSIFDGSSWSSSKKIDNEECFDCTPRLCVSNGNVIVVWQRTNSKIDSGDELSEIIEDVDLYYAVYNNGTFSDAKNLFQASNNNMEFAHYVFATDNGFNVVWLENSENNVYMSSGISYIKYLPITVSGTNYTIGNTVLVNSTTGTYLSYDGMYCNDNFYIAYSNSLNKSLFVYDGVSNEKVYNSSDYIYNLDSYDGNFYFTESMYLQSYSLNTSVVDLACDQQLVSYELVNTENKCSLLYYTGRENNYNIYSMNYNSTSGVFEKNKCVFYSDRFINDLSATINNDGKLFFAINDCDFDIDSDEVFDNYSLFVTTSEACTDVDVNEFAWLDSDLKPGQTSDINFEVSNIGNQDVEAFNYELYDMSTNTELSSGTIITNLASGEEEQYSIPYDVPSDFSERTLKIIVSVDEIERDITNNYATITVGRPDLEISSVTNQYVDDAVVLNATIKNSGFKCAEDVVLSVHKKDQNGEIIFTQELEDLDSMDIQSISIPIPMEICATIDEDALCAIELDVTSSCIENDLYNNEYRFIYQNITPYDFRSDLKNEITLLSYVGDCTSVNIPETLCDSSVKYLSSYFMYDNTNVSKVIIPDGVISIGEASFAKCQNLKQINIPDSVTEIGINAFMGCKDLEKITIPASVTKIGYDAFEDTSYSFEIYGYKNSYAEEYAEEYGIPFVELESSTKSVEIQTLPQKLNYYVGDLLDTNGLSLSVTYDSGTYDVVNSGFICSPAILTKEGTQTITVAYEGLETTFTVDVSAYGNVPTVSVSNNTVKAGQTFDVTVSINNNPGIVSTLLKIDYDHSQLTLNSVTDGGLLGTDTMVAGNDLTASPYTVLWDDSLSELNHTGNGTILTLSFTADENLSPGIIPIIISCDEGSTFNTELENVKLTTVNGSVTITDRVSGDANKDSIVNLKDVAYIRRWLAGWSIVIDEANSDVNADGEVTLKDSTLIRRWLVGGWGVELI